MQSATVYCPRCGASNDPQMPYCAQCGNALSGNQSQVGSNTVVQNNAPIAPPPPPSTSYGSFEPTVPVASPYPLAAPPPPPVYIPPTAQTPEKKGLKIPIVIIGVLVALLLIVGGVVFAVIRASTPTYPMLTAAYTGNVHNNTVNITSTFALTSVVEDQNGKISGNALVGSPLAGSGPFKGNVGTDKSLQFTIAPNDNAGVSAIHCTGTVQADGSLSGIYTIPSTNETGTWQVK